MNADHRRQPLERRSIEGEGIGQPAICQQGIRYEQLTPRRIL